MVFLFYTDFFSKIAKIQKFLKDGQQCQDIEKFYKILKMGDQEKLAKRYEEAKEHGWYIRTEVSPKYQFHILSPPDDFACSEWTCETSTFELHGLKVNVPTWF